jgi:hypothetical protein
MNELLTTSKQQKDEIKRQRIEQGMEKKFSTPPNKELSRR